MHHLNKPSEAFALHVPAKCTIERIMVDEHHLVALSYQWLNIFDLQAIGKESLVDR